MKLKVDFSNFVEEWDEESDSTIYSGHVDIGGKTIVARGTDREYGFWGEVEKEILEFFGLDVEEYHENNEDLEVEDLASDPLIRELYLDNGKVVIPDL